MSVRAADVALAAGGSLTALACGPDRDRSPRDELARILTMVGVAPRISTGWSEVVDVWVHLVFRAWSAKCGCEINWDARFTYWTQVRCVVRNHLQGKSRLRPHLSGARVQLFRRPRRFRAAPAGTQLSDSTVIYRGNTEGFRTPKRDVATRLTFYLNSPIAPSWANCYSARRSAWPPRSRRAAWKLSQ